MTRPLPPFRYLCLPARRIIAVAGLWVLAQLSSSTVLAQVSGRVADETGEPLIGVVVRVLGTERGTTTDFDGAYTLEAARGDSLEFRYVGFEPLVRAVDAEGSTVDVELAEAVNDLNEVVFVGYRSEQRRATTGAISTLDLEDVEGLPVLGIDQALQGRAAGVRVTNATGAPGADIDVRIRGTATVGSNAPLYVVDGVPIQGGLNQIAPGDIASLTILKDAAASIYGARSANGVVLITTKRGSSGTPRVSFESYAGVQQVGRLPEMLSTAEFIALQNEAIANTNVQREARGLAPLEPNPDRADTLPDVDWLGSVFRVAPIQSHRLGVSGASGAVDYLLSGSYLDQRGILLNSGFDRYALRFNSGVQLRPQVRVGINATLSRTGQDLVGASGDGLGGNGGGVIRYALLRPSAIPERDPDGTRSDLPRAARYYGDAYNPVDLLERTDWTLARERLLGNVYAEWSPVAGIQLRSSFGLDRDRGREKRFFETYGDFDRINATNLLNVRESAEAIRTWTTTATYAAPDLTPALALEALLGVETVSRAGEGTFASRSEFPRQERNFRYLSAGTGPAFADEFAYESGLLSFFGQAKLGARDRYFATVTLRRDGSSRFGDNNRFGYFPAAELAWSLADEPWLNRGGGGPWALSQLKLRASYGVLGNQEIGDYAAASIVGEGRGYNFGGALAPSATVVQLGNPDLRWERNTQANVGLDVGFADGAVQLSANVFSIETTDMLVPVPLSFVGGAASPPVINAGAVRNRGLELEAAVRGGRALRWSLGANAALLHNEVTSLGTGEPILAGASGGQVAFLTRTEPGHPIGSFYLYEAAGLFQTEAEVAAHVGRDPQGNPVPLQPDAVPGDVRFVDRNGDGRLDGDDRFHAGSPQPDLSYGLVGDLQWRGFDLALAFQGVAGNEIYHFQRRISEDASRPFNAYATLLDRWTGPGSSTEVPRVARVDYNDNLRNSTRFLEPGDYVRLKTLTLGYTVPVGGVSWLQSLRVYANAFNLLTWTRYSGLDPELGTNDNDRGTGDLAVGIDWGTYPLARTFTLGLNANL